MITSTEKTTKDLIMNNSAAQKAFLQNIEQMKSDMKRMQSNLDNFMSMNPDDINWGDAGTAGHYAEQIKEVSNQMFNEGEYK